MPENNRKIINKDRAENGDTIAIINMANSTIVHIDFFMVIFT